MISRNLIVGAVAIAGASLSAFAGGVVPPQPKAGLPLPDLSTAQLALFETGKNLFQHPLEVGEGLGPIFNKAGCMSCHANPLGGWGTITVSHFGMDKEGEFILYPGEVQSLAQAFANSEGCKEIIPTDATVNAIRVTNSSLAFGMIEAIPDADISANADDLDANGDGISGRVHWVEALEAPGVTRAGRFGWKAQVATTLTFTGDASRNEMGLTNRLVPSENPPNGNYALLAQCDTVSDPEDVPDAEGLAFIDRVTAFQRYLGVPPQTPRSGMNGETLFNSIGCGACHVAEWTTGNDASLESALRGKVIRPYSDFLLHDMGLLADGIQQGDANESEFRTPVLWNLRTRDPMLHNGSASGSDFNIRIRAAITAHGPFGEGAGSAAAFASLTSQQQQQVVNFLDSLGRLDFDADGDGHVDMNDLPGLRSCYTQQTTNPDDACAVADVDQDGDVDPADLQSFLMAYEGEAGDCNTNGVEDAIDIITSASTDADYDGVPDECGSCTGDIDGDGAVGGLDLALLLAAWGSADPAADLDDSGDVGGKDLALMMAAWGDCP